MYIHTDIFAVQSPKKPGDPCGDAYGVYRNEQATHIILADGLGSGIKAHIAANMYVSRILGLLNQGMTTRESFKAVSATMDKAWGSSNPFAVFTIARILNNGHTLVLSYEMPPAILLTKNYAQILTTRTYTQGKAIIHEAGCTIGMHEGLMLVSDGISQAGIGKHFRYGWDTEGVRKFIQAKLPVERINGAAIASQVHNQAKSYWPIGKGDDCSVISAVTRRGIIVNLMSGPPVKKSMDEAWVQDFIQSEGIHIACGGSTSKIAARVLKQPMEIESTASIITPPSYRIEGFELATEGVITLNQVYHLLDEEPENYAKDSPASELAQLLKMADKINVWLGLAENLDEGNIEFRQQGLLPRKKIMGKIIDKLRQQQKLVLTKEA